MTLITFDAAWEYQSVANGVPADPALEVVPVAGWATGQAPFGTIGNYIPENAPATAWAKDTGLWIRRNVAVSGDRAILITGLCEQAMYLYFNGVYSGTINPTNANREDVPRWSVVIETDVAIAGTHEIALLCIDDTSTGVNANTYIQVECDYLPTVIPFQPQSPCTEELQWLTDVQISKDGTEERLRIGDSPVQGFKYLFPLNAQTKIDGLNAVWGNLATEWLLPGWTQSQYLGAITAGVTTLTGVDTSTAEFREGSLAILWESESVWQVVGVDLVLGSSLRITSLTQAFTGAWLMPLRYANIEGPAKRAFNGYSASLEMSFRIKDNLEIVGATPTQYLGDDLYTAETLLDGDSLSDEVLTSVSLFDPGFGLYSQTANWINSRVMRSQRYVAEGQTELRALREFLHRRAGRYRQYWQPTFENDLQLISTGTITTTILVDDQGYRASMRNRDHIAIEADGVWYPRAITLVEDLGGSVTRLTLDSTLGVAADTVSRVSWLGIHRMNTDRVEIDYEGGGVATTSFRTVEIQP